MSRISSSPDTTLTMQSIAFPKQVFVKTIFQSHQLQPSDFQVNQVRNNQPDWVLAILVVCVILLAWVQVFYHKRLQQIFRAPFSRRFINQLTRDGNLFMERIAVALGIVYILAFSLFLYEFNEQVLKLSFHGITGIPLYWLITLLNIGVLAAKLALVQFLGIIFKTKETTHNYLLNLLIFALLSGPLLLATLIFIVYLKSVLLLYICLAVFSLMLVLRFIRGFFIGMALTKFSYLFLFVYLCSLEILPLLVLIKILLNHTQTTGT
ncbi:MAG: DUF4271 domain-containing protein [Bacteroidetes bacterium]|nr:DUF4271 domain-containing protein [Bacteroidota bacterium]